MQQSESAAIIATIEPFGFKAGMTKTQVIALVGQKAIIKEERSLELTTAPSPHPDFETYVISISSSTGLAQVIALSKDIETNAHGDSVKDKFDKIKKAVETAYGKPSNTFDYLLSGSIWNGPEKWMVSLLRKERTLASFWKTTDGSYVRLEAAALSQSRGYLRITYQFPNFDVWLKETENKRDSAF